MVRAARKFRGILREQQGSRVAARRNCPGEDSPFHIFAVRLELLATLGRGIKKLFLTLPPVDVVLWIEAHRAKNFMVWTVLSFWPLTWTIYHHVLEKFMWALSET